MRRAVPSLMIALTLGVAASRAGAPADPTQPPADRPAAATPAPRLAARPVAPRLPRVTSILLNRQGASSAFIDGRLQRVGDRLPGGERLTHIEAQSVTVAGAHGEQRLWLLADVATPAPRSTPPSSPPSPSQASVEVAGSKAP